MMKRQRQLPMHSMMRQSTRLARMAFVPTTVRTHKLYSVTSNLWCIHTCQCAAQSVAVKVQRNLCCVCGKVLVQMQEKSVMCLNGSHRSAMQLLGAQRPAAE
eukprot:3442251-Amphidinium_carterae.1